MTENSSESTIAHDMAAENAEMVPTIIRLTRSDGYKIWHHLPTPRDLFRGQVPSTALDDDALTHKEVQIRKRLWYGVVEEGVARVNRARDERARTSPTASLEPEVVAHPASESTLPHAAQYFTCKQALVACLRHEAIQEDDVERERLPSINDYLPRYVMSALQDIREWTFESQKFVDHMQEEPKAVPSADPAPSLRTDLNALTHELVTCDGCATSPLRGVRYRCLQCPLEGFDLCSSCLPTRLPDHVRLHPGHKFAAIAFTPDTFLGILEEYARLCYDCGFVKVETRTEARSSSPSWPHKRDNWGSWFFQFCADPFSHSKTMTISRWPSLLFLMSLVLHAVAAICWIILLIGNLFFFESLRIVEFTDLRIPFHKTVVVHAFSSYIQSYSKNSCLDWHDDSCHEPGLGYWCFGILGTLSNSLSTYARMGISASFLNLPLNVTVFFCGNLYPVFLAFHHRNNILRRRYHMARFIMNQSWQLCHLLVTCVLMMAPLMFVSQCENLENLACNAQKVALTGKQLRAGYYIMILATASIVVSFVFNRSFWLWFRWWMRKNNHQTLAPYEDVLMRCLNQIGKLYTVNEAVELPADESLHDPLLSSVNHQDSDNSELCDGLTARLDSNHSKI